MTEAERERIIVPLSDVEEEELQQDLLMQKAAEVRTTFDLRQKGILLRLDAHLDVEDSYADYIASTRFSDACFSAPSHTHPTPGFCQHEYAIAVRRTLS